MLKKPSSESSFFLAPAFMGAYAVDLDENDAIEYVILDCRLRYKTCAYLMYPLTSVSNAWHCLFAADSEDSLL